MNSSTRTLFLTIDPPYPATSGAPLRNWQNICLAAAVGPVAVVSAGHDAAAAGTLPGVSAYAHVVLERGGTYGVRGFPHLAGAAAHDVCRALVAVAESFAPDAIVLENVWLDGIVEITRGRGCRLVFDTHNVYAALAGELGLDADAVRSLERAAVTDCDELWVCSHDDAERIRREYPSAAQLRVIPNGIDTDYYRRLRDRGRRGPRGVVTMAFVGSYWYEPNRLAAELLIEEIVPAVRARTTAEVRLLLIGAAPSEKMRAVTDPGVMLAGRVADVRPYLSSADVIVVPLHQGGGTRLKLLEAFAARRPVVATAKAAEGIDVSDGRHLLLRESTAAIADAVVAVAQQPGLADHLTAAAYDLVFARYSWSALGGAIRSALVEPALGASNGAIRRDGSAPRDLAQYA